MKKIDYNINVLNLIEKLSLINQSILIEKEDGLIRIGSTNADETICYIFEAPETSFDFIGKECAFYNYSEFHKLFSVLDEPSIAQQVNDDENVNIELVKDRSKITYRQSDPEVIDKTFDGVAIDEPEVVLNLSSDFIKKLRGMGSAGMLNADKLNLLVEGKELKLKLWNKKHENKFEDIIELENEVSETFSFDILTQFINQIPEGDYQLSIASEGLVEFKLLGTEDVNLKIYTAEVEED